MANVVELTLLANDKASSVVNGVTGAVRSLIGQFMALAGLTAGVAGIGALVRQGIEFNKVMEDSRSGIASLILANNTLTDSTGKALGPAASLTQAFKVAAGVQGDLRKAALTTAASYQELVKGFQTAYGPATAAGITSLSKIKDITLYASQAVAALGLDSRQTSQELRALFTGEQGPDNTLTRTLGITKTELDKVRASGQDLGEYFVSKLKPFADVAAQSMGNFSTVVSNLGDAIDQISGEAFAPLFREIKAQAAGMGGAAGGLSGGLGAIGQGLADSLRALGPLIQALAALGVTAAKAGTDFLSSFAPIVPALTGLTRIVTGLTDLLGTNALALWAAVKAFQVLGPAAVGASEGLSLFFARMQLASGAANAAGLATIGAAFASLAAPVTAAALAIAAIPAAIAAVVLAGLKLKGMWEDSKADEAWARAAAAQQTFIEVLERKYQKTIEITASDELLTMAQSQRALVMDRVIKADKDGVITLDEVRSAMAAMTEETMKAKVAASGFADMQEKTKAKYQELLASLKAEIRIGGLEGLKKDLAVVAEEFRKKRDQIRKDFFDPGTGQWAQDPNALLRLLGIREAQELQAKAKEFAKGLKVIPEEIVADWDLSLKKLPDKIRTYYTAAQLQSTKTIKVWRDELRTEIEDLLNTFVGEDSAAAGVKAGWLAVIASLPTAAESAAAAVQDVWRSMGQAFDDLFFNVLSGRLDSLKDVFKNLWGSVLQTFSRYLSDMLQRWIATQTKMGQTNVAGGASSGGVSGILGGFGKVGGTIAGGVAGYGVGSMVGGMSGAPGFGTGAAIGGAIAGLGIGAASAGVFGAAATAAVAGSVVPIVGTIVGAIVGGLIAVLASKNTETHLKTSIQNMVGGAFQTWVEGWTDLRGNDHEGFWATSISAPANATESAGQKVFQQTAASMLDLFRAGAKDKASELFAAYQKALAEAVAGAHIDVAAGSAEDIQKDYEYVMGTLLPKIGLSAAFGQKGYLPNGNRDAAGGVPGIDWWAPGMDKEGNWIEKQLYDPEAPIPKMLAGLGFTASAISDLAKRVSQDDPAKVLQYLTGVVGIVVGLRDLGAAMGKTFSELAKGWGEEAAAGPAAAFGKTAQALADQWSGLSLYSGDERLKKAQEAQAASDQFWQSVVSYLQQLDALAEKLSAGLQGMREKMRTFLNPLSESGQAAADQGIVDATWGKLQNAKSQGEIETATNEAAAAIERMFSVLSERVTRGKALLERLTGLSGNLWDIGKDVASAQLEKTSPLAKWGEDLVGIQRKVSDAARESGLEQIAAIEDVASSAETLYGNLKTLLSDIASASASINKSIDSQVWELGVGELDATGQAGAVGQRIKELQDQLALATSPAEIQSITSEIQSLMTRYVGQFGKDDAERGNAVAWAQEQLERTKGLANEALDAMRAQAEAQAKELEGIIKGSVTLISTNVTDAAKQIGNLSFALGELDRVMRAALEGLGTAALDALAPLREAMTGAADIFTGATATAATALTAPETGLTASTDRAAARLDNFSDALGRAIGKLNTLAGGGSSKEPSTAAVVETSSSTSQVSPREVVPIMRRYAKVLTPRVA